jgi:hypothetical protein
MYNTFSNSDLRGNVLNNNYVNGDNGNIMNNRNNIYFSDNEGNNDIRGIIDYNNKNDVNVNDDNKNNDINEKNFSMKKDNNRINSFSPSLNFLLNHLFHQPFF